MSESSETIKKPRRKKLTGEEIGRIFVKDLVSQHTDAPVEHLTIEQKQEMMDSLKTKKDQADFAKYRLLFDYLKTAQRDFEIFTLDANVKFWSLYNSLTSLRMAEEANYSVRFQPKIMTQKQYDEIKTKTMQEKLQQFISPEDLIYHALTYYLDLHKDGNKTPLDKHFKKAEKEALPNQRMIHSDAIQNKLDVLERIGEFYHSSETGIKDAIKEFITDFPTLYNDLITLLSNMEGLSFIGGVPLEEYTDKSISYKILYDNNVLDFPARVKWIDSDKFHGVAIIDPDNVPTDGVIDSNGHYIESVPIWRWAYMAESFIEEWSKIMGVGLKMISTDYKTCYAIRETIRLLSEWYKLPEINAITREVDTGILESLNDIMEEIPDIIERYGANEEEMSTEEVIRALRKILKPINIDSLKPTKKALKEAKELISPDILRGRIDLVYDVLMGA